MSKDKSMTDSPKPQKDKAAKTTGFAKPSEAKGVEGWNMTEEAEDRLMIITPLQEKEVDVTINKRIESKKVIVANVVVINEKRPDKSEEHTDVFVFGGWLRGSLREYINKSVVAARLVREKTDIGVGYQWKFEDATDDEEALCREYQNSVKPFGNKK